MNSWNMRKYSLLVGYVALATLCCSHARINAIAEYSITPSSQLAHYHYPAPSGRTAPPQQPHYHQQQHHQPSSVITFAAAAAAAVQPQQQARLASRSQSYQTHQLPATAAAQPRALQQSQQQQQHRYYQQHQHPATATAAAKQFAAPALESAAFTMALRSQGYHLGASPSASAVAGAAATAPLHAPSLNVKLPVPFGFAPIKAAPLPLQAGAPYDSIRKSFNSYAPHPHRR